VRNGLENLRLDVSDHGELRPGGPQVLSHRKNVASHDSKVVDDLKDFFPFLSQPYHDARLGDEVRSPCPGLAKELEGPVIIGTGANAGKEPSHGLQVVGQNFGACLQNLFQGFLIAPEVRNQDFDRASRGFGMDASDDLRECGGSAIRKIVPGDGCDHNV
jgi:hypothetical protein